MLLRVKFSKEYDEKRIRSTLDRFEWLHSRGYRINLPTSIKEKVAGCVTVTDAEIKNVVESDFDETLYENKKAQIVADWRKIEDSFTEGLDLLKGFSQLEYFVTITKYGVGGSYHTPDKVILNIDYSPRKDAWETLAHEIIHLNIEPWVQEYKIEHWTKERVVDLIFGKIFPDKQKLQTAPAHAEEVHQIFNAQFPNIHAILADLGRP